MLGLCVGCLLWAVGVTAVTFEVRGHDPQVICLQGLSNCSVSDELPMEPYFEAEEDVVDILEMQAWGQLCCRNGLKCKLCLAVKLQIHLRPQVDLRRDKTKSAEDGAGQEGGRINGQRASVTVCYKATALPVCKRVRFTLHPHALPQSNTTQLSLEGQPLYSTYGSTVVLSARSSSSAHRLLEVSMPTLDQVCSPDLHGPVEECDVPRIKTTIDLERSRLELQVVGSGHSRPAVVCLKYEKNGNCRTVNTTTIPLSAVTTCLCIQAWWRVGDQTSRRAMSCPFKNHTEALIQRNEWEKLSVSLALVERSKTLLLWNLSAPCRLDAEVWPCCRGPPNGCKEITSQRKKLSEGNWRQNNLGQWEIPGAFEDFDRRFPPCVMVKVNGMGYELGPFCTSNTDVSRWRWNTLIVATLPVFILVILLLYIQHNKIKRWAKCWHSGKYMHSSGVGQVVVLSPPDSQEEEAMCELVCGLGSFLKAQGLEVELDQWSRTELCSLGPLPWLHGQLLRLEQRGGGKVVLVWTRGVLQKAQEWTGLHGGGVQPRMEGPPPTTTSSFPYSDIFSAALSCVARDRLLGHAGERFLLVDFESCPAQLACSDRRLPELLEGLRLLRLPSQNQVLLHELVRGGNSQRHKAKGKGAARYIKVKEKTSSPGPETIALN